MSDYQCVGQWCGQSVGDWKMAQEFLIVTPNEGRCGSFDPVVRSTGVCYRSLCGSSGVEEGQE